MEKLKGYKTFIFGLIVAALPLLNYVNDSNIFSEFISDPKILHLVFFTIGAGSIILRAVTNTPMFKQSGFSVDDNTTNSSATPTDTTTTNEKKGM